MYADSHVAHLPRMLKSSRLHSCYIRVVDTNFNLKDVA